MSDPNVGYKRPPRDNQFKKGQSGNPAGRPQGARSVETVLADELRKKVSVREGGRTRLVSKLELFVRKRVNDGIQGNARDGDALVRLLLRFLPTASEAPPPETLSQAERAIVARYFNLPDDGNQVNEPSARTEKD